MYIDGIFFSVIIPCYNSETFLTTTFRSLKEQTFKNFEIVLIDDNSLDKSFDLASELIRELAFNAQIYRKPKQYGRGVALTRNLAIEASCGKWLVFLDSDDAMHPMKLEFIYNFIENNPDIEAVAHSYITFRDESEIRIEPLRNDIVSKSISLDMLVQGNVIGTSTVCLSRDLYRRCGPFDVTLNGVEDYFLWMKIATHCEWTYLDVPLTFYRLSPHSLMCQRPLAYYVTQNFKLWTAVKLTSIFRQEQLHKLYDNLFRTTMSYYVGRSLHLTGYLDFFLGLIALVKRGLMRNAIYFFSREMRRVIFNGIQFLKSPWKVIQR